MQITCPRRPFTRRGFALAALFACAGLAGCGFRLYDGPTVEQREETRKARELKERIAMTMPSTAALAAASTQPATFPTGAERAVLTEVTQLTSGFDRAGEGYFSADGKWVIFQATPKGEKHYQMFVAQLLPAMEVRGASDAPHFRTEPPRLFQITRITPPNSRNTCGYFAPDGKSLIFGSTAGKEVPEEPGAGYQRQGGNYRWDFPDGMEIYRANDWLAATGLRGAWKFDDAAGPDFPFAADIGPGRPAQPATLPAAPTATQPTTMPASFAAALQTREGGADPSVAPTTQPATAGSFVAASWPNLATPANRLTDNAAYDAEGTYSADGKWIVFTSRRTGDAELWAMRPDGSNPVQLTHVKGYDGGPFFSPDGKRLVYRSDRKGNDLLQIFVADVTYDAAGNITGLANENQLTNADVNWGPSWHPDGEHIIYATSKHGHHNYELYSIRADGSHATRITYSPGFDGLPVFSPDGKQLMWSAKRSADNTTQLFIANFHPPKDW